MAYWDLYWLPADFLEPGMADVFLVLCFFCSYSPDGSWHIDRFVVPGISFDGHILNYLRRHALLCVALLWCVSLD